MTLLYKDPVCDSVQNVLQRGYEYNEMKFWIYDLWAVDFFSGSTSHTEGSCIQWTKSFLVSDSDNWLLNILVCQTVHALHCIALHCHFCIF